MVKVINTLRLIDYFGYSSPVSPTESCPRGGMKKRMDETPVSPAHTYCKHKWYLSRQYHKNNMQSFLANRHLHFHQKTPVSNCLKSTRIVELQWLIHDCLSTTAVSNSFFSPLGNSHSGRFFHYIKNGILCVLIIITTI